MSFTETIAIRRPGAGEAARRPRVPWPVQLVLRLGGMAVLLARSLAALVRPPFAWRRELGLQSAAMLGVTLPVIVVTVAAWGFSGPGLQAGNFLTTFGAIDRSGGFMVVAIAREFGTFVTATVVAGVAGTAFTAELAARRVRGELDALLVLGVDPVTRLVAPRILAFALVSAGLDLVALLAGVAGGYAATVGVLGGTSGAFTASFVANTTPIDLVASVLKVALFGLLTGTICAWHGLNAPPGAEGAGRAVNRAVVGSLVAIFVVNLAYTQYFLAAFPQVGVLR